MPRFPFLFEEKAPGAVRPGDPVVVIPGARAPKGRVVVAKPEAIALVEYLLSLKRSYPVPAVARAHDAGAALGSGTPHAVVDARRGR
jgi:cytochrome c oxidase cbb3-type subunit 2